MSEEKSYPKPSLTADAVVIALDEQGALRVLFIRRGNEPFKGRWALPGGFCEPSETVAKAALRERMEEIAFELLPEPFTLEEARRAFEVILGGRLDRHAFEARLIGD